MGFRDVFNTALDIEEPGNIAFALSDAFQDDLAALKAQLEQRNIKVGKEIARGSSGIIFELENAKGDVVNSAVIRIDPADMIGVVDSPATIRQVFSESAGYYAATIVPRAEKAKFEKPEYEQSLAVLHADNKWNFIKDIRPNEFMKLPGIEMPVITDLSCMNNTDIVEAKLSGFAPVQTLIETAGLDVEKCKAPLPAGLYDELKGAQDKLDKEIRQELAQKGIDVSPVPPMQQNPTITAAEPRTEEKER